MTFLFEYRITKLESDVARYRSEVEALRERERKRLDFWLSAAMYGLCGIQILAILWALAKIH